MSAAQVTSGARVPMIRNSAGRQTKKMPTAVRPVGPAARVMVAMMVPTAAGRRRWVEMARSKEAHVSMTPRATMGSGRTPLL